MIPIIATGILSWFAGLAARFFTDHVLRFAAYKLLLYTFIVTTVPIICKNLIVWIFEEIVSVTSTVTDLHGMQVTVLNLTGAAGYIANLMMIPDCISIIMTAIVIRFTLNFIPFVG